QRRGARVRTARHRCVDRRTIEEGHGQSDEGSYRALQRPRGWKEDPGNCREAIAMSAKESFLRTYDEECARTMRLLRAYPTDKLELKPAPPLKTARELAWIFVGESMLGGKI